MLDRDQTTRGQASHLDFLQFLTGTVGNGNSLVRKASASCIGLSTYHPAAQPAIDRSARFFPGLVPSDQIGRRGGPGTLEIFMPIQRDGCSNSRYVSSARTKVTMKTGSRPMPPNPLVVAKIRIGRWMR